MTIHTKLTKAATRAHQQWKLLGSGRHRMTFALDAKWVIKIPYNQSGIMANESEYEQCQIEEWRLHPHVAWCYLDYFEGVPVCVMERVRTLSVSEYRSLLGELEFDWIRSVDCGQIGYSKWQKKLVAYDYSEN